jgi:hypothetical protein
LEKARVAWQTGLDRYGEHAQAERLFRSVYTVALGEVEPGLATLRSILSQEKPPRGLLQRVLETARLLHRCPGPIDGSEDVIHLLEEGIRQAPVFILNPEWASIRRLSLVGAEDLDLDLERLLDPSRAVED